MGDRCKESVATRAASLRITLLGRAASNLKCRPPQLGKRQADPYEQYKVLKLFTVVREEIAPAFGKDGGGTQLRAQIPEVSKGFATIDELTFSNTSIGRSEL